MACSAELSFRSRLGKAAAIGGLKRVNQVAKEYLPKALAANTDTDAVLKTFCKVSERAPAKPVPLAPVPSERVKVRWTDELIAQLRREARWCKTNEALTRKLGLPDYCLGSVERGRRRYAPDLPATRKCPRRQKIESPAADLLRAA